MPQARINSNHITRLKAWMSANKDDLLAAVYRIDAHYIDNDLSTGAFEDIQAYHVTDAGSRFTKIPLVAVSELNDLLEALTEDDNFFRGRQGGGGTFRLLLDSETIEHASFEYVTANATERSFGILWELNWVAQLPKPGGRDCQEAAFRRDRGGENTSIEMKCGRSLRDIAQKNRSSVAPITRLGRQEGAIRRPEAVEKIRVRQARPSRYLSVVSRLCCSRTYAS